MLVAIFEKQRINAALAQKGGIYFCPGCQQEVILKKGKRVVHHFAHKPPVTCSWSKGETQIHLKAKSLFYEFFSQKGFFADVEFIMNACRADVHVEKPNHMPMVFEMQHTSISETEIADRTREYFSQNVAMTWLPLMDFEKLKNCRLSPNGYMIDRYSPKQHEKWLHGFNFGEIWYLDPKTEKLWRGKFEKYYIEVPYKTWFESGGYENSAGGYEKTSKRWRTLALTGPFSLEQVTFSIEKRKGGRFSGYDYPSGYRIRLMVEGVN